MMATRDNLAFAVSTVSQFMSKAGPPNWMAVKCIMRDLIEPLDFKLCLRGKDTALRGFCDVHWTGNVNDRRSTTWYVFFCWCWSHFVEMQETTNHWMHYMGTSHCTKKTIWLRQLLGGCGIFIRRTDIHHVWQSIMYSTCKESHTPFSHQTYQRTTSFYQRKT